MLAENLAVFFAPSDFASTATIGAAEVSGLFDNGYQAALAGFIESSGPSFMCASSDIADVVQGSTLSIDAIGYRVTRVSPDGTGVTTLALEKT